MSAQTRLPSTGETVTPTLPHRPVGRPGFFVISVQRVAAVGGLEEAAAGAAARHRPRRAERLPERREHARSGSSGRVVRSTAPLFASRKSVFFQRLAAVGGLEDAAFGMVVVGLAEHRRVDGVAVGGMHAQPRHGLRVLEAEVRPRLAAVGRAVDAVALDDVAAERHFPAADVDDVGIALAHAERAHRRHRDLAVGHRRPRGAAVGRLPGAAADRAEPVLVRPGVAAADGDRAAAAGRARRCATACRCRARDRPWRSARRRARDRARWPGGERGHAGRAEDEDGGNRTAGGHDGTPVGAADRRSAAPSGNCTSQRRARASTTRPHAFQTRMRSLRTSASATP